MPIRVVRRQSFCFVSAYLFPVLEGLLATRGYFARALKRGNTEGLLSLRLPLPPSAVLAPLPLYAVLAFDF